MHPVDFFMGVMSSDMGIDLGTVNTLICMPGQGVVLFEPSVVAVRPGTSDVLLNGKAVGNTARAMFEKAPSTIIVTRPLRDGVIADFDLTEAMLRYFIRKVHKRKWGVRPRVIIAIPAGITAVEKRAVVNSLERAGARDVYLISEPKAAAIGCGLPISEPMAHMIVDVGGGTTEVAVISLGDVFTQASLRVAGDKMDEAIIKYMRANYNLEIGYRTAESVKIDIGSAYPTNGETTMDVRGRDAIAGLPRSVEVNSEEMREALRGPVDQIIDAVKTVLEQTAPELASDLLEHGMVLAGGGALLRGLDRLLHEETGIPVHVAEDPITVVARGTGVLLENLDLYKDVLRDEDAEE
ncbi:MAG: rod shape-determining protein [Candidatus Brocadiales bacterium]